MTTIKRRTLLKLLGLPAAAAMTGRALAQGAGQSVRMIVPFPAGSSNDTSTRVLVSALGPILGQAIVVDNRTGGSGVVGTMELIRSRPDGMTLMAGTLSPLAANVAFVKSMPYDPLRDVTPIAGTTSTCSVLIVRTDSPISSVAEFIAYAKQKPNQASIGYSSTTAQLQIASMNKLGGVQIQAVPYRGAPASVTDVLGGTLTATLANTGPSVSLEKAGRIRVLGVSSRERNALKPDWPAIAEALPGYDFPAWNAIVGPPRMARDVVFRLSEAVRRSLEDAAVTARLAEELTVPFPLGPDELRSYMEAEIAKYVRLAREAGIEPE